MYLQPFLEARLTWQIGCCFKILLSELPSRNNPETALIPPQSCTVASRTSMLSPQRTAPSNSASPPPKKHSPLKFVAHVKQFLADPFSTPACTLTSSKVNVPGVNTVNSVIPLSSFSTPQTSNQSLSD